MEKIIPIIVLTIIILSGINWLLFAPNGRWKKWFAWYPVKVKGKHIWLKTIERRKYGNGSCSETDNDWIEYRLL